ncbi:hypothetical protein JCM10450v2_001331 [Rhodotorula kratochvilovae]
MISLPAPASGDNDAVGLYADSGGTGYNDGPRRFERVKLAKIKPRWKFIALAETNW